LNRSGLILLILLAY